MRNVIVLGITIAVITLVGVFYWYEWRPTQIRQECHRLAASKESQGQAKDDFFAKYGPESTEKGRQLIRQGIQEKYELCLHEKGLM